MPLFGQLALWLALLMSVWGAVVGFGGGRYDRPDFQESARRASVALAGALLGAVAALVVAILRLDFRVAYVAAHADRALATGDAWAVLFDGVAGRVLVCAAAAALWLAAARHAGGSDRRALAHTVAFGSSVVALAVVVLLVAANPFRLLSYTPIDGQGLGQRLQGAAAQLSLAFLCLGGAAAVVPGGRALAARLARYRADDWDRATRLWLSVSWMLLTVAVALALWADYYRRGWNGAWLGDSLRGIALPAWVVVTGLIHYGARSGRRWGVHVAHAGGALLALGLGGAAFRATVDAELRPGESTTVGRYALTYLAASVYPARYHIVTRAVVEVRRGGRVIGRLAPRLRQQLDVFGNDRFAPEPRAGVRGGLWDDVHGLLLAAPGGPAPAHFRFAVNPLGCWVWVGLWLVVVGGLVTLWPARRRA